MSPVHSIFHSRRRSAANPACPYCRHTARYHLIGGCAGDENDCGCLMSPIQVAELAAAYADEAA